MRDLTKGKSKGKARSRSRSRDPAGAGAQDTANENMCCSPKGCRHENSKEVTDMASAVKVICSIKTCKEGVFMHEDCFFAWEDDIIKSLQSHYRQKGRLQSCSVQQLQRDLWTKRVHDVTYKICVCRCGGYLKKDLEWDAEKDAEKPRNNADDTTDKKKKKKKGDKPGILGTKKACHKVMDVPSKRSRKALKKKGLVTQEPKVRIIPNPSQGAIGGHESREARARSISAERGKSFRPERGQSETTGVADAELRCGNKRESPEDTPFSSFHDDNDDIPISLALDATYWWVNFGWRTYLDFALYANEQLTADSRTQSLVTCKSVNDVERALGCRDLRDVSERLGEWWQEVGWDEFRSFMEHQ
ncbi:uncharacterized protein LOC144906880 [Branchiostoma floridae x Branchiostoma belcheri]